MSGLEPDKRICRLEAACLRAFREEGIGVWRAEYLIAGAVGNGAELQGELIAADADGERGFHVGSYFERIAGEGGGS